MVLDAMVDRRSGGVPNELCNEICVSAMATTII